MADGGVQRKIAMYESPLAANEEEQQIAVPLSELRRALYQMPGYIKEFR
jgi:hypothetical protein